MQNNKHCKHKIRMYCLLPVLFLFHFDCVNIQYFPDKQNNTSCSFDQHFVAIIAELR